MAHAWTDRDYSVLFRMLRQKRTFSEIAPVIGVSRSAVSAKVTKLRGAGDPRLPGEGERRTGNAGKKTNNMDRVAALLANDFEGTRTARGMATFLNLNVTTVRRIWQTLESRYERTAVGWQYPGRTV